LVFPEAAAKGLLLIGPDHGGPREILDDGRLGWCVDAFSPDALAQALSQAVGLSDGEADRRRALVDQACRARFAPAVIGPQLRRAIAGTLA
jgi:glycosyltransferase involved in cell wall biosynthesis